LIERVGGLSKRWWNSPFTARVDEVLRGGGAGRVDEKLSELTGVLDGGRAWTPIATGSSQPVIRGKSASQRGRGVTCATRLAG